MVVSGSVRQSGAIPVSGLRVVAKKQEGKHVANHPSHRRTVQRHHQPGHHVAALPADRRHLRPAAHDTGSKGPHHREVDPSSPGQSTTHHRRRMTSSTKHGDHCCTSQSASTESQVVSFAGLSSAKELLLSQGAPVGPSVQRRLHAEEDLGCCQQVACAALHNCPLNPHQVQFNVTDQSKSANVLALW